jgi:GRAM domain-containing protein 4
LVLRVIFALLKRRIFSHPSLEDLRRHREEVICANEFGDQVSARLSAPSTDVTEVIYLFKLFEKRRNKAAKQKAKDMNPTHPTEEVGDAPLREPDMAVPEDTVDKEKAADIKRFAIYTLNEITDLHERVKKCVPFS